MNHQEIEKQNIIERYVRHQLTPAERQAFQEHFFACEECFAEVQTVARFVAGVRQAARQGQLAEATSQQATWWANLFSPLLILTATAALAVTLGVAWFLSRSHSSPAQQLALEQQPSPTVTATRPPTSTLPPAEVSPTAAPSRKLEDQRDLLAQNRPPEDAPAKTPSLLLESSRDASVSSNQLTLPANATQAILRLEIEPGSGYASVQCQVSDSTRRLVATASGKPSPRGVVSFSIPASPLQNGKHLVKCHGIKDGQRLLVGEYDLNVRH